MTRIVPVDARQGDWPRVVAGAVNDINRRATALEGQFSGLSDYADDTAAAAGGVLVGGLYRTGSTIKVRVT